MPIGSAHWVKDGMVHSLRATTWHGAPAVQVTVVNQFFHAGRPLGWWRKAVVDVDGTPAAPRSVAFILRDQVFPLEMLPELHDVWWGPGEEATFVVGVKQPLEAGEHTVGFSLTLPLVNFTAVIDRDNVYPTFEARLEETLPLEADDESEVAA